MSVTGARASSGGARDLFTEETSTVLVFKDGAVIRLTAPVSIGQLLFLTNKKSKTEVVCQVLHTRSFRAAMTYVELQFTEEKTDFWGVAFPAEKKAAPEFSAKEHVEAEATTVADPHTTVEPHKEEDVELLKQEVEALRQQLLDLEKKSAAEATAKAEAEAKAAAEAAAKAAAEEAAKTAAAQKIANTTSKGTPNSAPATESAPATPAVVPAPQVMAKVLEELEQGPKTAEAQFRAIMAAKMADQIAPVNDPSPEPAKETTAKTPAVAAKITEELAPVNAPAPETPKPAPPSPAPTVEAPLMPTAIEKKESPRGMVGMALPIPKKDATKSPQDSKDPADELLPKPSLDFSKAPAAAPAAAQQTHPAPRRDLRQWTAPVLSALLVLFGCMVWYGKLWTYVGLGSAKTATSAPKRVAKPLAPATKPGAPGQSTTNAANTDAAKDVAGSADNGASADASSGNSGDENNDARAEDRPVKKSAPKEHNARAAADSSASDGSAPNSTVNDAPILPAKLLKSANPVYPPDAMRSFITGDVKAEVLVAPDGHVSQVKVLSGPKPFQQAAVDALKQYKYAPATQGGKPVVSKVIEVVKFWFNP